MEVASCRKPAREIPITALTSSGSGISASFTGTTRRPSCTSMPYRAAKRPSCKAERYAHKPAPTRAALPGQVITVVDALTEGSVWWDGNRKLSQPQFQRLLTTSSSTRTARQLYAQDLFGGADPAYRLQDARIHRACLAFAVYPRSLLIRPERAALASFVPDLTIVDLPSFKADPERHGVRSETVIAIDFSQEDHSHRKLVLCAEK